MKKLKELLTNYGIPLKYLSSILKLLKYVKTNPGLFDTALQAAGLESKGEEDGVPKLPQFGQFIKESRVYPSNTKEEDASSSEQIIQRKNLTINIKAGVEDIKGQIQSLEEQIQSLKKVLERFSTFRTVGIQDIVSRLKKIWKEDSNWKNGYKYKIDIRADCCGIDVYMLVEAVEGKPFDQNLTRAIKKKFNDKKDFQTHKAGENKVEFFMTY